MFIPSVWITVFSNTMSQSILSLHICYTKFPITYTVYMFQDYNYNSSMVQVTILNTLWKWWYQQTCIQLRISTLSGTLPLDTLRKWWYQRTCILS